MENINRLELLDMVQRRFAKQMLRKERVLRKRSNIIDMYTDDEFRCRFRFSKSGFRRILEVINHHLRRSDGRGTPLSPEHQLLIALRFFATGSLQRVQGDLIGVHSSVVCRCVHFVAKTIVQWKNVEITFPSLSEVTAIASKFSSLSKDNFPGVIGAIDCTHIRIQCPDSEKAQLFINRKLSYSINCQVISDPDMLIRNIVVRWPGSANDSMIFENSEIKQILESGRICGYLLGDSSYSCRPYLLTPVLNPCTAAEKRYNKAHSRAWNVVKRLFGVWKRRFPCVGSYLRTNITNTVNIILATAILHNWAIKIKEEDFPGSATADLQENNSEDSDFHTSFSDSDFAMRRAIIQEHFSD